MAAASITRSRATVHQEAGSSLRSNRSQVDATQQGLDEEDDEHREGDRSRPPGGLSLPARQESEACDISMPTRAAAT